MKESLAVIIAKAIESDASALVGDSGLGVTPGWDSFAHTLIILDVEESFGVSFDADELQNLTNFESIRHALEQKVT